MCDVLEFRAGQTHLALTLKRKEEEEEELGMRKVFSFFLVVAPFARLFFMAAKRKDGGRQRNPIAGWPSERVKKDLGPKFYSRPVYTHSYSQRPFSPSCLPKRGETQGLKLSG